MNQFVAVGMKFVDSVHDPANVCFGGRIATSLQDRPFLGSDAQIGMVLLARPMFMRDIARLNPGVFSDSLRGFIRVFSTVEERNASLSDRGIVSVITAMVEDFKSFSWAWNNPKGFAQYMLHATEHHAIKWREWEYRGVQTGKEAFAAHVHGRMVVVECVSSKPACYRVYDASVRRHVWADGDRIAKKLFKAAEKAVAAFREVRPARVKNVALRTLHIINAVSADCQEVMVNFPYIDRSNCERLTDHVPAVYYRPYDCYFVAPAAMEALQQRLGPEVNIKFVDVTDKTRRVGARAGETSGVWDAKLASDFRTDTGYKADASTDESWRRKILQEALPKYGRQFLLNYLAKYRALHRRHPAAFANYTADICFISRETVGQGKEERRETATHYERYELPFVHDTSYVGVAAAI